MQPAVWAPAATAVDVVVGDGRRHRMERSADGWHRGGPDLGPGDRYGFALDGGGPLPDPRARWQPDGVHGLSAVDDPSGHRWGDGDWRGVDLLHGVTYELHVGTFTPRGTLDAAIDRLDHLVELGIDAVELLPLAEAMGERGWGYDGVHLWAVHHAYGGPAALRRFVDAAHQRSIGVLLDVVYNHLGPEGAYLDRFGPYFSGRHHTPWGAAVNLDGPGSGEVRRFIVDNARHWCVDHHVDGLRIDAVHALVDDSPVHVVAQLTAAVHGIEAVDGRRRWVVIEDERPDLLPLLGRGAGWGVDARWGDDLHHALHAHLTGERDGYYAPYGRLAQVAEVLERGQLAPAPALLPTVGLNRLVVCSQNHDQVGNRPRGERLEHLVGRDRAMGAAAVALLGPGTPLLFQGEEWATTSPFPFFADTDDDDLADRIRTGRAAELAPLGWRPEDYLDPLDGAAGRAALLDWSEPGADGGHTAVLAWYRRLLRLRRRLVGSAEPSDVVAGADEGAGVLVMDRGPLRLVVVTGERPVEVDLGDRSELARWGEVGGPGSTIIAGPGAWA